jgi:lipopolysaccharide transport system ATP-binding protein
MRPAIQIENVSKRYRIGARSGDYRTLREAIVNTAAAPWRRLKQFSGLGPRPRADGSPDTHWALKDVSFEVPPGEVIGLIGRNGAGKSTLLKILSRITEPTSGRVTLRGRVGSLLEVGTGFHPELTGRENVYLNGAILGMARREIVRKFDEIVDFAEVAQFLDTPVKRYSSGMYMRLAFAVAAHLEPEILVVDEVLAVGDAGFQKKCLGKMGEVARGGRTVLFVSHNMAAVLSLCSTVFLLDNGRVANRGLPDAVVEEFLRYNQEIACVPLERRTDRRGEGFARVVSFALYNATDPQLPAIRCGDRLKVELTYESERELDSPAFLVGIAGALGQHVYRLDTQTAPHLQIRLPRRGKLVCVTDPLNLCPGRHFINLAIMMSNTVIDHVTQAAFFDVEAEDFYGTGVLPHADGVLCLLPQQWHFLND